MVSFWDKTQPQNFKGWSRFLTFLQLFFQKKKKIYVISNSENSSWEEPLILSSQDATWPFSPQCFDFKNQGKFPESLGGRKMSLAESWKKNPKKRLLFLQVTFCSRLPRLHWRPGPAAPRRFCHRYLPLLSTSFVTKRVKLNLQQRQKNKNELNTAWNVLALWIEAPLAKSFLALQNAFTDHHLITKQKKCFVKEWKDLGEIFFSSIF